VEAIVLTHGHEDHIGGIPYLLKNRVDIPIIGSKFTLALTELKTREAKQEAKFIEVKENQRLALKTFALRFVAVNHSIPDALAVFVKTRDGSVLDTGDIKLDQTPLDRRITDLNAFADIAKEGVDLMMVDSTNADVPGFVPTEISIEKELDFIFTNAARKIVVTSFASHIHRIQQIFNVAAKHRRVVCLDGRSMLKTIPLAKELGLIEYDEENLVPAKRLGDYSENRVVIVSTGSQGEPMAALSRIAKGNHASVTINPGDVIIFASSIIPGNEKGISRIINQLALLGAEIFDQRNAKIHVSGHAAATELLYLYNIVKPRNVLPVHGEPIHLIANQKLAQLAGVAPQRTFHVLDGTVLELLDGEVRVVEEISNVYVKVMAEAPRGNGRPVGRRAQS
jgi:ribonuclease J